MKIKDVYTKFKIIPNLQEHMLRVAGLARVIIDNWKGEYIDEDLIVKTLLIHDLGNMVKIDFEKGIKMLGKEKRKIGYWKNVQKEIVAGYGKDDHKATVKMAKEIGASDRMIQLLSKMGFVNNIDIEESNNQEIKICNHSDHRIVPSGVTTLGGRFEDAKRRYKDKPNASINVPNRDELIKSAFKIEEDLQEKCKINLQEIRNKDIEKYFDEFLNIEF